MVSVSDLVIFACDPGGSTGWSSYSVEEDSWDGGQFETDDHHKELWSLLGTYYTAYGEGLVIVSESFEFRNDVSTDGREGLELVSREYIGVMKLFAQVYGVRYYEQMPSHALRKIGDDKLEALELVKRPKHPNRHYHDSLRHLLLFLVFRLKAGKEIRKTWKEKLGRVE